MLPQPSAAGSLIWRNLKCAITDAKIPNLECQCHRNIFPCASMPFDKFHVMKLINDSIDKVRLVEQSRYVLPKNTRISAALT
ncbi:MAG TPA: transposase [Methanothrix sp.]|nr:transposase [Methanothrix sp.]